MINLLPPQEKEELLFQRNKKLIVVLGTLILISLVCLGLILFSLRFYILGEANARQFIVDNAEKKYTAKDFQSFKTLSQTYNANFQRIDAFYKDEGYMSDVLQMLFSIPRPAGLYFTNIAIKKETDKNAVLVTIAGRSASRDSLLSFKGNLENNHRIKNIVFPPENWVKPKDIFFQGSLEISLPHTNGT